jgi:hypothetical protein
VKLAAPLVALALLAAGAADGAKRSRPLLVVRPVPAVADTYPGRAGTLAFKVRASRPLVLVRVRQRGRAACGLTFRARRLNVRLRPGRWTTVRLRRTVRIPRTAPSSCQRRAVKIPVRVTARR